MMRHVCQAAIAVSLMLITNPAAADEALPKTRAKLAAHEPLKIVCLGDSVTGLYYHTGGRRAYPDMVAVALRKADPQADVTAINAGISGNSTVDALQRLEKDVLAHRPDLVTVMFGLNDMVRVPLPEFQDHLTEIVNRCRGVGAEVLLCTPNGVIDSSGRPIARLLEYCAAMKEVGTRLAAPVCDCYAAYAALHEKDPLAFRLLLSDAIHPNMDGHKLNAEEICRAITGQRVSLADEGPLSPAIPKSLGLLKAGQPLRVLAMAPYDQMLAPAVREAFPEAKVEVTAWPTADQSLAMIHEAAKTVRAMPPDLVLIAVPLAVTPVSGSGSELPGASEAEIDAHSWILNFSLSFGRQEWDVVGITPSVLTANLTDAEQKRDAFSRRMFRAQDLSSIDRPAGSQASPQEILVDWLREQARESP